MSRRPAQQQAANSPLCHACRRAVNPSSLPVLQKSFSSIKPGSAIRAWHSPSRRLGATRARAVHTATFALPPKRPHEEGNCRQQRGSRRRSSDRPTNGRKQQTKGRKQQLAFLRESLSGFETCFPTEPRWRLRCRGIIEQALAAWGVLSGRCAQIVCDLRYYVRKRHWWFPTQLAIGIAKDLRPDFRHATRTDTCRTGEDQIPAAAASQGVLSACLPCLE